MEQQTRIGIILLGIIAIVALIGLLLLLKGNITQYGIGVYSKGISETAKLPPYQTGKAYQFPAGPEETIGTRTPVLIFFKGTYATIYETSQCWNDLTFILPAPQDMFSCYAVPVKGVAEEATGWYPPSSRAKPKIEEGPLGGDIYCYERTPRDRNELITKLKPILLEKGWYSTTVNGLEVLNCQKGIEFIYPQGIKTGYYR